MNNSEWADKRFGKITVARNARARRIIMRAEVDGIRVTVPPHASLSDVQKMLDEYADRLKSMQGRRRETCSTVDFSFFIDTDLLKLTVVKGERRGFYLNRAEGRCQIICPADTDFCSRQEWLKEVVVEQLRIQAKAILPVRTKKIAEQYGFIYNGVKIQSSKTCWGSCSQRNNINLSLYLMTLPSELVDYVIKHELCHTVHHDHSPAFWKLMDEVTEGRAKEHRECLKKYKTSF